MKSALLGLVLVLGTLAGVSVRSQNTVSISSVASSGAISENRYINSCFNLTVDAPTATLQLSPAVNTTGQYARLVQVLSDKATWENTYTLAVNAEPLTNLARFPDTPPARYVRSVRHQLEKEGLLTVREEFPISIGGEEFTGAVLQVQEENGRKHYRGIYTTFRKGYILSIDAEASSEANLSEIVTRMVKFGK